MRDGIVVVDADGHVMDRPHRCYQKYLPALDLAILYPTTALGIGQIREPEYQAALCRAYNDFMADWCKADPKRLKAVALAPYLDPTEAARDLDRAVAKLGAVGLMFPTFIPGRNVADPFFWPIYEEAERLGVPVAMHATGSETSSACTRGRTRPSRWSR